MNSGFFVLVKGLRLKVKAEILIRSEIHCVRIGFIHYRRYFCIRRTLTRYTQLKTFAGFIISKKGLQLHWLLVVYTQVTSIH